MDPSETKTVLAVGIDAHGPDLLDLPSELRALIQLFDTDDRPSALLARLSNECVYKNEAFEDLEHRPEELDQLLQTYGKRWEKEKDSKSHIDILDNGRIWRSVALLERTVYSLVCLQVTGQDAAPTTSNAHGRALETSSQEVPSHSHENAEAVEPLKTHVDWTRQAVPGLKPWVEYIRTFDWSSTYLGPMDQWSELLRSYVYSIMMNPMPRILVWGEDYTFLYNEAASILIGAKHPMSLGQPLKEGWNEIWNVIGPLIEGAYAGKPSPEERMPLAITRTAGFLEETYWTFCLLPVMDVDGTIVGCLDELQETTHMVTGDRRRKAVLNTSEQLPRARSLEELWKAFLDSLKDITEDIPYALVFSTTKDHLSDGSNDKASPHLPASQCKLEASLGLDLGSTDPCTVFSLTDDRDNHTPVMKAITQVCSSGEQTVLRSGDGTLPDSFSNAVLDRGFGDPIQSALVAPILYVNAQSQNVVLGVLVIGLNPRSLFDQEYSIYINITIDLLTRAASLISFPEDQRQAQKLATNVNTALAQQLQLTTLKAERSEAKFSHMAASSPVGMFVYDLRGTPLYVNDKYLEIIGKTREESDRDSASAASWAETIHEDDLDHFISSWSQILISQAPVTIEYRLRRPLENGMECWLLANAFPEFGPDGKITTVMGWLTDISHNKYAEKLAYQRLEDALENKRQTENFLDMTSHEMRNPLSAILQSADWIVSTLHAEQKSLPLEITHELVDAAETVILCAQHQKRIVDDILTLSKLDASLLVISPDRVRPPLLISKALKMYEAEIMRADITATLCVEPTYTELDVDCVLLDSSRLLQVVINLLTNAIKFTKDAETRRITIFLGASLEKPTGRHHEVDFIPPRHNDATQPLPSEGEIYVQVAVQDSGKGLSDGEMKVLFQRFSQGNAKTYKSHGGSGLGLFISRELCELQGGQIGVSSGGGKTSFTFFVKAKRWTPDDDTMSNVSISYTSTSVGSLASRRGSLVTLGEMRSSSISAVPVNGSLSEADELDSQPRTFPIEDIELAASAMHVLIVEDNLINQKILAKQLSSNPTIQQCYLANHGLEAISFLEASVYCAAKTPLSLILLDLEMPTMDGLTCIRHIRAMQADGRISGHVPVIAVTANARPEQISTALEAGMDQVVTKPFRIPELVPQMRALVREIASRYPIENRVSLSSSVHHFVKTTKDSSQP